MGFFQATSLRSRVARKLLAVFLICALTPFVVFTLITFYQVSAFFEEKNQRQFHALNKSLAADLFERLLLSKASLGLLASKIDAYGTIPDEDVLKSLPDIPAQRWQALAVVTERHGFRRIWGDVRTLQAIKPPNYEALTNGATIMITHATELAGAARVFMATKHLLRNQEYVIVIGELADDYFWHNTRLQAFPLELQPCVITTSGHVIKCVYRPSNSFKQALGGHVTRSSIGNFQWSRDGQEYHIDYRTISNQSRFNSSDWIVATRVVSTGLFSSLAHVRDTFLLAIIACFGTSFLMATYHFRKRLSPVEILQEGTRRIGQKEFDVPLKIKTGDEFEELAVALNTMAIQLRQQFTTIETTAQIDRAVLSLLDAPKVIETILNRLVTLLHCDCASFSFIDSDETSREQGFLLENSTQSEASATGGKQAKDDSSDAVLSNPLQPLSSAFFASDGASTKGDPVSRLAIEANNLFVTSDLNSYAEIRRWDFVRQRGLNLCLAAPLFVRDDILGVMSFYAKSRQPFTADEISLVKGVVNQAAIAIFNAQLFERTSQQADELEKANKVKDDFLGIISHELRTPLNLIRGYSKMMQEKVLGDINPDQEKAVETILRHSNELLEAIENIMEATKLEAGAVLTKRGSVNLCTLFEELKPGFTRPPDKDLAINWQCSSSLPPLMTDEAKLKRILQNLIDNAIKFTDDGQVTIAATLREDEHLVELKVADTGIGIPQDVLPLLFELFRQKDSSTTRQYGGLGLGLYVVKKPAKLIGAQINVESKIGIGSTFTVILPAGDAEHQLLGGYDIH